jgi:hypothetical protein
MGSQTVAVKFRTQMDGLSKLLESTHPHFVRCVKPNKKQEAHVFDGPMVMEQLNYLGVLETVRIRQMGYPVRKEYHAFVAEFWVLRSYLRGKGKAPKALTPAARSGSTGASTMYKQAGKRVVEEEHKRVAEAVVIAFIGADGQIDAMGAHVDEQSILNTGRGGGEEKAGEGTQQLLMGQEKSWQLGQTRLFLRDGVMPLLEKCVWKVRRYASTRIATAQRRRRCFSEYTKARRSALICESVIRMFMGKCRVQRKRKEAVAWAAHRVRLLVPLQAVARGFIAELRYKRQRVAALKLHCMVRGMLARKLARLKGNEFLLAQRIQSGARGKLARKRYAVSLGACVRIQQWVMLLRLVVAAKLQLQKALQAVRVLQLRGKAMLEGKEARTEAVQWLLSDERVKQGELLKRSILGRYGFNWKLRTFELDGLTLSYSKTKGLMSKFKTQAGTITINASDTVVQTSSLKPFCFMVRGVFQGLVQELFCVASSDEEREGWMKEIQTKIIAADFRSTGVNGGGQQITVMDILRQRIRVIDPSHGAAKPVHTFPTLLKKRQSVMEQRKSMVSPGATSKSGRSRNGSDDSGDGDASPSGRPGGIKGALAKTPSLDAIA